MTLFRLPFIPLLMNAGESSFGALIGFGILLLVLLMILKQGKPRSQPTIVQSQTPQQWTDDPIYAENRRLAVAAAFVYHLDVTSKRTDK